MVGKHVILDLYGCDSDDLQSCEKFETILTQAALEAKATIISSHFHSFGEGAGITGVVVLAESHISVHTWNELDYAAIDIFMCGHVDVEKAVDYITEQLSPFTYKTTILKRGEYVGLPSGT